MTQGTILLVEDNPDDVALTLRAFKKNNISNDIVVAYDGAQAQQFLAVEQDTQLPALVLLDLKLPKVSGLDVLRGIRANERTRYLPVVVLTTSSEERDVISSYHLGANSFVRKPVDFYEFVEAVRALGIYWLLVNEPAPERDR